VAAVAAAARRTEEDLAAVLRDQAAAVRPGGKGVHSFRFQLNLSSSVHRGTQLNPECVLELLKLSSNVNECQPLPGGQCVGRPGHGPHAGAGRGRTVHSNSIQAHGKRLLVWFQRLKLHYGYDETLLSFADNFSVRRYSEAGGDGVRRRRRWRWAARARW